MKRVHRLLAILLGGTALNASAGIIDSFDDPNPGRQTVVDTGTTGLNTPGEGSSYNGTGILGGQRDIFVIKTSGPDSATDGIVGSVENGAYAFASATGHAGLGIIRWDGTNTGFNQNSADDFFTNLNNAIGSINSNGVASTDLTAGGFDHFELDVASADAGFNFTLQVFSNGGAQFSQLTITGLGGPSLLVIPYASFRALPELQCAGTTLAGCADFTMVTAMQAIINFPGARVADLDTSFRSLTTGKRTPDTPVPAPGMLSLAGGALLAALAARRKRRPTA